MGSRRRGPATSLHGGLSDEGVEGAFCPCSLTSRSKSPYWMGLGRSETLSTPWFILIYRIGLQKEGRERCAGSATTRSGIDLQPVESLAFSRSPLFSVPMENGNDWLANSEIDANPPYASMLKSRRCPFFLLHGSWGFALGHIIRGCA